MAAQRWRCNNLNFFVFRKSNWSLSRGWGGRPPSCGSRIEVFYSVFNKMADHYRNVCRLFRFVNFVVLRSVWIITPWGLGTSLRGLGLSHGLVLLYHGWVLFSHGWVLFFYDIFGRSVIVVLQLRPSWCRRSSVLYSFLRGRLIHWPIVIEFSL